MGSHSASHTVVIDAPAELCFDLLTDYERLAEWQRTVISAEVLEHDRASGDKVVETTINALIKKVRYVMRNHFDRPHRIWWEYLEGDVRSIDGEYRFTQLDDGSTQVECTLEIDPGSFVPGPIKKLLAETSLRGSLEQLKERAESLAP